MPALSTTKEHIGRIRLQAENSPALGPFWREILLSALTSIDEQRSRLDRYGLVLATIRDGDGDPVTLARDALAKTARATGG